MGREWLSLLHMLQEVASLGAPLFALFEHPAPRLLDGVALMMRAVAEGGVLAAAPMREAALAEGALLSHLLLACTQQVITASHNYKGMRTGPGKGAGGGAGGQLQQGHVSMLCSLMTVAHKGRHGNMLLACM